MGYFSNWVNTMEDLQQQMRPGQCDHTLSRTRLILGKRFGPKDVNTLTQMAENAGCYCDCEVILNVSNLLEAASEKDCANLNSDAESKRLEAF